MITTRLKNISILLGIILGMYIGFRYICPLIIPFLISILVAILCNPLINKVCENTRLKRGVVSVVLVVIICLFLIIIIYTIYKTATPQIGKLISYFPFYREKAIGCIDGCCNFIGDTFSIKRSSVKGAMGSFVDSLRRSNADKWAMVIWGTGKAWVESVFTWTITIIISITATIYTLRDFEKMQENIGNSDKIKRVVEIIKNMWGMAVVYIKAQGLIGVIDIAICIIGLRIIDNPYYILLGILIGVVDMLPIFGAGIIIIPCIAYSFVNGDVYVGIVYLIMYIACIFVRQIIEPKMLGGYMDLYPVVTIFMMYVGYRIFGVIGFIIGPVGFLLAREIYKNVSKE